MVRFHGLNEAEGGSVCLCDYDCGHYITSSDLFSNTTYLYASHETGITSRYFVTGTGRTCYFVR